jgi:glycosyltransferase involved in cell wall biosynthesis
MRAVDIMNARSNRFRHLITSVDGRYSASELISQEVDVEMLSVLGYGRYNDTRMRLVAPLWPLRNLAVELRNSIRLIKQHQPDLILCYGVGSWSAAFAAQLLSRRYVWFEDGFNYSDGHRRTKRRIWLRRSAMRGAAVVVVPSKTLENICLSEIGLPRARLFRISNGVSLSRFSPRDKHAARKHLFLPEQKILIGTVCHLRPEKRIDLLLEVVPKIQKSVHLVIAGTGPCEPELRSKMDRLDIGERVTFLGHQRDVSTVLGALDLFVCCSETEQMPLALLEAMACAKPAIVTDVGDCAAVLDAGNWPLLVPARDAASLASAISDVLSGHDLEEIGTRNRRLCEQRYSSDGMIEAHSNLYERVIGEDAHPRRRV